MIVGEIYVVIKWVLTGRILLGNNHDISVQLI